MVYPRDSLLSFLKLLRIFTFLKFAILLNLDKRSENLKGLVSSMSHTVNNELNFCIHTGSYQTRIPQVNRGESTSSWSPWDA